MQNGGVRAQLILVACLTAVAAMVLLRVEVNTGLGDPEEREAMARLDAAWAAGAAGYRAAFAEATIVQELRLRVPRRFGQGPPTAMRDAVRAEVFRELRERAAQEEEWVREAETGDLVREIVLGALPRGGLQVVPVLRLRVESDGQGVRARAFADLTGWATAHPEWAIGIRSAFEERGIEFVGERRP